MPETLFWSDIVRQPSELQRTLDANTGAGRGTLRAAGRLLAAAPHVYLTGIGSSWHAGMAVETMFAEAGRPVHLADASELLHFAALPDESAVVIMSRSGRSIEIVKLLSKCHQAGARVVAITNTPESPLGQQAELVLPLGAGFDHNVSVAMYTGLALVGGLLAAQTLGTLDDAVIAGLASAIRASEGCIQGWRDSLAASDWLDPGSPPVFLARGTGLAACHETRLLWEEAAKTPAVALGTGGFRHGPQEVVTQGTRVGIWLDERRMRREDLALAADLTGCGARVMLVGQGLPAGAANPCLEVPETPPGWQFVVDIMPLQVAAELHSHLTGGDCDTFRLCPYVIEEEGGL